MDAEQLLEEIAHQFDKRAQWWRNNTNDPHQISTATMVALEECREVIRAAIDKLKDTEDETDFDE